VGGAGTARQAAQSGHYPAAESHSDPARHQYHEHRHWQPGTGTGTTTTSTGTGLNFNDLQHLNSTNYAVTIDQVKAVALFSDADTKIMQNPKIRATDNEKATLTIADKIPIATGSFARRWALARA